MLGDAPVRAASRSELTEDDPRRQVGRMISIDGDLAINEDAPWSEWPITKRFGKGVDVYEVQAILGAFVAHRRG